RVPAELWALVSKTLKYIDLKRLARVCKAFKAIFEVSLACSLRLFLKPPAGQLQAGTGLAIHPMLEMVNYVFCEDVDKAEILCGEGEDLNAFDYAAADEFATAPACTKIKLEMNERKCGTITNQNGVTVRQVMKRAIKYWTAPVTGNVANQVRREWGWAMDHPVTRRYTLGDHCFFEGWDYAKVQADGSTPPIALRIPPELWVLVSEELEYIDLKRLAGACKAFKAMLEQPHYGERLFFKPPTGQLEPGTDLAIHPILDGLDLIRCEDVDTADFLPPRHRLNAFDYPAADKFATAPACTKIEIVMDDQYEGGTVTCQSGVTVRQVIKRVLEYWNA
ncbi:hypothetical protein RHOSPDRAFT_5548, partial [Rhodotorula sp. JG-1b]